ncbi:hypothetical protein IMSHALPRED_004886 [Imshaugia aleurites]|uniref:Uncharacterized protein n=1 Tax=Imshaugia aleurites TaxID=172621 RepID=A0A8H3F9U8_9LECA|nr:hypothetical protein IMSHALPRED_004886 [Imshaugia aleurites]
MTTQTIRTRDGNVTILTAPPLLSYPPSRSKESAPMLPLPSIGNQRKGDGWPDWATTSAPSHLIQRNYNADLQLPAGWPPGLEWRPPYGSVPRSEVPARNPKFDPRSMLWWSQWEIVFAKKVLGLSDADTCSLFRFRWQAMDKSTRYMQPFHVAEIMAILSDGHPWHAHAFRSGDPRPKVEIGEEFLQDLRMAKQCEQPLLY